MLAALILRKVDSRNRNPWKQPSRYQAPARFATFAADGSAKSVWHPIEQEKQVALENAPCQTSWQVSVYSLSPRDEIK